MILFLDIDGVLVNRKVVRERDKFYAPAVAALNQFCAIPECRIVISSAWRVGRSVEVLAKLFKDNGVGLDVVGKTPSTKFDGKRGLEILDWINKNNYNGPYIVIDDEDFDIAPFIPAHKIIRVKNGLDEEGLTKSHITAYFDRLKEMNGAVHIVDPWWQLRPFIMYVDQMIKTNTKRRKKMPSGKTTQIVETVVEELVRMRRTFTGEDVYNRIHSKYVRRSSKLPDCNASQQTISREVRRLFNTKNQAFKNYGSTIVNHSNGPVLYFALPYHAKVKAKKICDTLNTSS